MSERGEGGKKKREAVKEREQLGKKGEDEKAAERQVRQTQRKREDPGGNIKPGFWREEP